MSDKKLDPEVEKELENTMGEEEIIGMESMHGESSERVPLVEKFSPEEGEWGGKSVLHPTQPRAITLSENLAEAFPVLLPSEEFIENFVEDYEMRLTSVGGTSREQLTQIFMSMFGVNSEGENAGAGSLELMLSSGPEDDE